MHIILSISNAMNRVDDKENHGPHHHKDYHHHDHCHRSIHYS